jgi:hypothetical protein
VSAIAAENAKVTRNRRPWVSVALLTPLTPAPPGNATANAVKPNQMLDELFAAYQGQLNVNAHGTVNVRLLLANAGDSRELTEVCAANELIKDKDRDRIVAVTGMGISSDTTATAARKLSASGMLIVGAATTADELRTGVKPYNLRNYYKVVPSVSSQVARLATVLRLTASSHALLVHERPGRDIISFYSRDLFADLGHSFQDSEQKQPMSFTPDQPFTSAVFKTVALRECQSSAQQGYILYAGRASMLSDLIKTLETTGACDGKRITIVTGSDVNSWLPDIRAATAPLPGHPRQAQVAVDYTDALGVAKLTEDYKSAFAATATAIRERQCDMKDSWGIHTYDAMIVAGTAIHAASANPTRANVVGAAQDILNSAPMDGATGQFRLDSNYNGGLLNAEIPVFEYSDGRRTLLAK